MFCNPFSMACVKVFQSSQPQNTYNFFEEAAVEARNTTELQGRQRMKLRCGKSSNALGRCVSHQCFSGLSRFKGETCLLQPISSYAAGLSAQQSYILNCSCQVPAIKTVPGQINKVCGGKVGGFNSCLAFRRRTCRKIHK